MGRYGRFVDMRTIDRRIREKDARRQRQAGTLFPAFLQPEIVPFVEVEIVPVSIDTSDRPDTSRVVVDVVLVPKDGGR